jgi:uncharacterized repeat protein (TIGR01451 family)/LPXTG-motif cell wall-anchored protein
MNNKFLLPVIAFALFALFVFAPKSQASVYIINPTPTPFYQLSLNKMVQDPRNGVFYDNLNSDSFTFLHGQEALFKLEVKNNSNTEIANVRVKDVLPSQLDFVEGPGSYDGNARTLSFSVDKLGPGELKTYYLKVKTNSPADNTVCATNFAEARSNDLVSQDTSVVCIGKKVLGVTKELPKTGISNFEMYLLGTVLFSLLAIGFAKRSQVS